jgi:hypothetical protein
LQTGTNGLFKPPKGNNHLSSWDGTAAPEGCIVIKVGTTTGVTSGTLIGFVEDITVVDNYYS